MTDVGISEMHLAVRSLSGSSSFWKKRGSTIRIIEKLFSASFVLPLFAQKGPGPSVFRKDEDAERHVGVCNPEKFH